MSSGITSFAQCGEDVIMLFLARHLLHLDDIYYLDIGSNDPVSLNNTHLFYNEGYRGVSVDANPYFTKRFASERPDDTFVNCGIGTKNGKAKFYQIDPHTLSTFSEKEALDYTKSGRHTLVAAPKVKLLTIRKIIDSYCKQKPNIFTLDVEGMDLEILSNINFDSWRPDIICVETLTYTEDSNEKKVTEIIDLLVRNNYRIYADTYINTIFVSEESWAKRI